MSIVNGLVKAPIGLAELAGLLNCGADVGQCCTSDWINKWSKKKPIAPVATDATGYAPFADTPAALSDYVFKLANYGLSFSVYRNLDALKSSFGTSTWTYAKPQSNHWKRLTDFEGYYHYAKSPLPFLNDEERIYPGYEALQIPVMFNEYDEEYSIPLRELHVADQELSQISLDDFYLGVYLTNGKVSFWATNTKKGIRELEIEGKLDLGEWDAWLFASSVSFSNLASGGNLPATGHFIPLDQTTPAKLNVTTERPDIKFSVSGEIQESTGKGNLYLDFYRQSAGDFRNVYIYVVAGSTSLLDESRIIYTASLGTVSVGNDATVSRTVSFTANSNYNAYRGQQVFVLVNIEGMTISPVALATMEEEGSDRN